VGIINGTPIDKAKLLRLLKKGILVYRSQLPPPKTPKDLKNHPMADLFKQAESDHLESHKQMRSRTELEQKTIPLKSQKSILDCMWVYVYRVMSSPPSSLSHSRIFGYALWRVLRC
jgi:hypothetical protein